MCCNPNLLYVSYLKFLYNCFLKFIVYKMNFEMVKSVMVVLTGREKTDVSDADVVWAECCRLVQTVAGVLVVERVRESWCDMVEIEIETAHH
jgi:Tfp pilus assembly protein PilZ